MCVWVGTGTGQRLGAGGFVKILGRLYELADATGGCSGRMSRERMYMTILERSVGIRCFGR